MERGKSYIGWICALGLELVAAQAMLDANHGCPSTQSGHDENSYMHGKIGQHDVLMAPLPAGEYGTASVARVAKDLQRSFSIEFCFLVGIAGGVPTLTNDLRLGDVVESKPGESHGGVIQYDLGKIRPDGSFKRRGHLNNPPHRVLNAVSTLQAEHFMHGSSMSSTLEAVFSKYPAIGKEFSRPSEMPEAGIESFDKVQAMTFQTPRSDSEPKIHYGLIASGNKVIANKIDRDRLQKDEKDILCFEMEAAGIMNVVPCLVVRGISDFADGNKNDTWQPYAAMAASAYAKDLLLHIHPPGNDATVEGGENQVATIFEHVEATSTFVGRDEELKALESYFASESKSSPRRKRFVIHGIGGIGKTQLCLEYMRRHKDEYESVLWINGATDSTVKSCLRHYLTQNFVSAHLAGHFWRTTDEEVIETFQTMLSSKQRRSWLLIFDNVDLEEQDQYGYNLCCYLSKADHGHVMVTTRLRSLRTLGKSFEVGPLSDSEAIEVLEAQVEGLPQGKSLPRDRH